MAFIVFVWRLFLRTDFLLRFFRIASLALSLFFYPTYYIHFASLPIHFSLRFFRIASLAPSLLLNSCAIILVRIPSYLFTSSILSHRLRSLFLSFSILLTTSISLLFLFISPYDSFASLRSLLLSYLIHAL